MQRVMFAPWIVLTIGLGSSAVSAAEDATTVWPLTIDSPSGRIKLYQPQPDAFQGDRLDARAAVSWTPAGAADPVFGAMWMTARVSTDRDDRTVTIRDVEVKDVRFPGSTDERERQFAQVLKERIPPMRVTFSLDQLTASLDLARKEEVTAEQLRTKPPRINFSSEPATLVTIDGPPKLQRVDGSDVMRVVNTPFVILTDPRSHRYYLKAGDAWASASDVAGPWAEARDVPQSVLDVGAKLVGGSAAASPGGARLPRIIVATEPTELVVTKGPPAYAAMPGDDLLYVSNTEMNVFLDVPSQETYLLLSGRWYRARSTDGPWEYVPADKLSIAFHTIPENSAKAAVLPFVAGTRQAKEAVLDASIPQTAAIRRDAGADLKVKYDGDPRFKPIEGTPLVYAVNTQTPLSALTERITAATTPSGTRGRRPPGRGSSARASRR